MSKVTIATVKSFIKKNRAALLINKTSSFDSMTDCVEKCPDGFSPAVEACYPCSNNLNIGGVWIVTSARNWCGAYEKNGVKGFEVDNCCGSFIVGIPA